MDREDFIVGMDVDGVLRNWVQVILQQVNAKYNTRIFNKHISDYDLVPFIQKEVPGFDREALNGIHKRCAETGKLAEATAYKDGLNLFAGILAAGFSIKLLTNQPVWAREAFYRWIARNSLADKIISIEFLKPEAKALSDVKLLIDDNPRVIEAAGRRLKPAILWLRNWNRDWRYPRRDIPEKLIEYTALPDKALKFIEYHYELRSQA